ncbi:PEP-CTERM sorting domain-containing protein [Puniceicoccaceae bacterium K14]|nr:PEP-CTERM sorting domain-containing protein [Puniceicoccaceae bacterium K14]
MKTKLTLFALIIAQAAFFSQAAFGQVIYTLEGNGTFDTVTTPAGYGISEDSSFSFSYTFDASAPDLADSLPNFGAYFNITDISIATEAFEVSAQSGLIFVENGDPSPDLDQVHFSTDTSFTVQSGVVGDSGNGANRDTISPFGGAFFWDRETPFSSILSNDSLNDGLFNLDQFTAQSFVLEFFDNGSFVDFEGFAAGSIDNFTLTAVPEPSTIAMVSVFGLVLLFIGNRKRKKLNLSVTNES